MSYVFNMVGGGSSGIAYIGVTYPAGSVCTCSNGTIILTADDTSGVFLFPIPTTGNWTVSCTDGIDSVSESVSVATNHAYNIVLDFYRIEPFATTSDINFVRLIQAAHKGLIDLERDVGWSVGNKRTIQVNRFTSSGGVTHAQQSIDIAISSFNDYEGCGCVMQFDFVDALAETNVMNNTNTTAGGYGASIMKTVTLPALVNALPVYLRNLLIEFNCRATAGSGSSTIVTITGNKLALRSAYEVTGSTGGYCCVQEGEQIPYYKASSANRVKKRGHSGSSGGYWFRSPSRAYESYDNTAFGFTSGSSNNRANATGSYGIAPFGCI